MAENSSISWTDHTFNPWMGCFKVSDGCKFCYAEELMDKRYGKAKWGAQATRVKTSDANWRKPLQWNKQAKKLGIRYRVFCASLADVFEDKPDQPELEQWRRDLFELIISTPQLDWLILTKRPENLKRMLPHYWVNMEMPDNVWLGTSVENQEQANKRIPELLKIPARVRFLSCEPLLEPITIFDFDEGVLRGPAVIESGGVTLSSPDGAPEGYDDSHPGIDWVIVGGESGHNARAFNREWASSIRKQCRSVAIPFFMKQFGSNAWESDNSTSGLQRMTFSDRKGETFEEFPRWLQSREFPR